MSTGQETDASIDDTASVSEGARQSEDVSLIEMAAHLKEMGRAIETFAYQAAGRASADMVAQLIILAAEVERLANRLSR